MADPLQLPVRPRCPDERCGAEWVFLPTAVPLVGYQPMMYKCRKCRSWLVLIYEVWIGRQMEWKLVRILPSLSRHPARIREILRGAPELNEHIIELTIELLTRQPDICG